MSLAKLRSKRSYHALEHRWLVWNHGNWTKVDRMFKRAERRHDRENLRHAERALPAIREAFAESERETP